MAIYLVDYENVYIDGLQGMNELTQEDTVHIFYTQNRCGLTFGLYEQLISCKAAVHLNEVAMSLKNSDPVKNALDIQLMMFAGYLIGCRQSDRIYIISKDKDFQLGTEFFARYIHDAGITLGIIPSIAASLPVPEPEPELPPPPAAAPPVYDTIVRSLREEMKRPALTASFASFCEQYAKPMEPEELPVLPEQEPAPASPMFTVQYHNTVRNLLGKSTDEETVSAVCRIIYDADNLVDLNNALAKYYRDGQRAKTVYHKFKPRFEDLRHLSHAASRKG
ncbi:MAG: hypothetical protein IJ055_01625 [Oscillospiraceae bacterium]|nr:hypothetical protein [Oscillospiraceae bacterium]